MESAGVMPCPVLLAAACLRLSRLLSAIELRELHWTGGVVLVRWLLLLRTPISIPSEVSLQPALRNTEPISRCTHRATATGHNMGGGEGVLSVLISTGLPWNWKVGGGVVLSAHIYWASMEPGRLGEGVLSVLTSTGLPWNLQGWGSGCSQCSHIYWAAMEPGRLGEGVLSVLTSTGLPWNLESWGRGCSQCSHLLGCHGTWKVGGGVLSVLTSTGLPRNLEGWGMGCSQCSHLLGCHGTWKVGGGGVLSAHIYWAPMEPGKLWEGVFSVLTSTGLPWNLEGWGRGCSKCSHLLGCHRTWKIVEGVFSVLTRLLGCNGTWKNGGGGCSQCSHIYWAAMEPGRLGEGVFSVLTSTGLPWNPEGWGRGCSQCSHLLGFHRTWKVGGGGVLSAHIYWAAMEPGRLGEGGVLSAHTSTGLPWNLAGWERGVFSVLMSTGLPRNLEGGGTQCSQCSHLLDCHGTWKVGGGGVLSAHIY